MLQGLEMVQARHLSIWSVCEKMKYELVWFERSWRSVYGQGLHWIHWSKGENRWIQSKPCKPRKRDFVGESWRKSTLHLVWQGPIQKVDPASGVSVRRPTDLVCQSLKQCARERDKQDKQGTRDNASWTDLRCPCVPRVHHRNADFSHYCEKCVHCAAPIFTSSTFLFDCSVVTNWNGAQIDSIATNSHPWRFLDSGWTCLFGCAALVTRIWLPGLYTKLHEFTINQKTGISLGGFLCSWEDILCTLSARFAFMDVQSILKEKEPSLNPVQSFYHTPASVNPVQAWNFQHIVWSSSTSLELQARLCGVDDGVEARQGLHVQDLGATCHTEERPFLFWCRDDPSQKDFAVASTCVADCAVWFGHL